MSEHTIGGRRFSILHKDGGLHGMSGHYWAEQGPSILPRGDVILHGSVAEAQTEAREFFRKVHLETIEHTPIPWEAPPADNEGLFRILRSSSGMYRMVGGAHKAADRDLIIKGVNNHAKLVRALQITLAFIKSEGSEIKGTEAQALLNEIAES